MNIKAISAQAHGEAAINSVRMGIITPYFS